MKTQLNFCVDIAMKHVQSVKLMLKTVRAVKISQESFITSLRRVEKISVCRIVPKGIMVTKLTINAKYVTVAVYYAQMWEMDLVPNVKRQIQLITFWFIQPLNAVMCVLTVNMPKVQLFDVCYVTIIVKHVSLIPQIVSLVT